MYNNDYIIAIDENGQPYIAHSWLGNKARAAWGSLSGRATKYKGKVRTKSGKIRYIYDELVGNNAKRGYQAAQKNYWASKNANGRKGEGSRTRALREAADKSKARYEKTLRGRVEKLGKSMRSGSRRAKNAIEKYGKKSLSSIKNAPDRIKDKLGYDERDRLNAAKSASAKSYGGARNKQAEVNQLQRDYNRTVLGVIDNVKKKRNK